MKLRVVKYFTQSQKPRKWNSQASNIGLPVQCHNATSYHTSYYRTWHSVDNKRRMKQVIFLLRFWLKLRTEASAHVSVKKVSLKKTQRHFNLATALSVDSSFLPSGKYY